MFFEKLSTLCDEKGIKPNTIAKAIGLSSAVATKWKSGALPNGETLCRIADYLECSVDYLLDRSDMKKDNPEGPPPENIDNEILNMAAKMSPEDRKALIAYMEFLVERRKHTDGNPQ